jgi:4-amino-4-deoxy-L-arabinose transferase-like glycosyltransferase
MNPAPTQPVSAAAPDSHAVRTALILLASVTLFRLWYAAQLGLVCDETYYWMWSRHLAASYTDKGPAIALLIALGTWVFGDNPFGIRWLGVLLAAGTGWQIFRLARRLYGDRVALWSLVVACLLPLFAVGSVIMTIDTPSVFCWAWAVNVFWTALESGRTRHWIGLGLIIGAGFLAKFTNGVQLGCLFLFLLWSAPHRRFLVSRQSVALVAAFLVCTMPVIWWNMQVGWLHAAALHSRSGLENSFQIRPAQLLRFLGEEVGVISPLIALGMVIAAAGLLVTQQRDPRVRLLLSQFVPLYAIFTFFSLSTAGKGNWPAPALVTAVVLVVVFWQDLGQRRPAWRYAINTALGVAGVMTVAIHVVPFIYLPPTSPLAKPLHGLAKRSQGWEDLGAHVQKARDQYQPHLLIANHYSQASLVQFHLADHPKIYQPTGWHPQFALWGGYALAPGTRALFITDDITQNPDALGRPLKQEFKNRQLVDDFWTQYRGQNMTHLRIYLLTND